MFFFQHRVRSRNGRWAVRWTSVRRAGPGWEGLVSVIFGFLYPNFWDVGFFRNMIRLTLAIKKAWSPLIPAPSCTWDQALRPERELQTGLLRSAFFHCTQKHKNTPQNQPSEQEQTCSEQCSTFLEHSEIALKLTKPFDKNTHWQRNCTHFRRPSGPTYRLGSTSHGSSDFCPLLALWRAPSSSVGRLGNVAWLAKMGRWNMWWYDTSIWLF